LKLVVPRDKSSHQALEGRQVEHRKSIVQLHPPSCSKLHIKSHIVRRLPKLDANSLRRLWRQSLNYTNPP